MIPSYVRVWQHTSNTVWAADYVDWCANERKILLAQKRTELLYRTLSYVLFCSKEHIVEDKADPQCSPALTALAEDTMLEWLCAKQTGKKTLIVNAVNIACNLNSVVILYQKSCLHWNIQFIRWISSNRIQWFICITTHNSTFFFYNRKKNWCR